MISDSEIDEIYRKTLLAIYPLNLRLDPFDHKIDIKHSTRIAGQLGVMGRFLLFLKDAEISHDDQLRIVTRVGFKHEIDDIFTTMSEANLDWYKTLQQKPARQAERMTGGDIEFYQRESERWNKWREEAKKLNLLK